MTRRLLATLASAMLALTSISALAAPVTSDDEWHPPSEIPGSLDEAIAQLAALDARGLDASVLSKAQIAAMEAIFAIDKYEVEPFVDGGSARGQASLMSGCKTIGHDITAYVNSQQVWKWASRTYFCYDGSAVSAVQTWNYDMNQSLWPYEWKGSQHNIHGYGPANAWAFGDNRGKYQVCVVHCFSPSYPWAYHNVYGDGTHAQVGGID